MGRTVESELTSRGDDEMVRSRRRHSVTSSLVVAALLLAGCDGQGASDARHHGSRTTGQSSGLRPAETPTIALAEVFPEPGDGGLPQRLRCRLDKSLREAVAAGSTLGVTAAVVTDRGAWVGAAGTGLRGEPLTPGSSLMYASITKTFTAAEVVLLASRGDIDLDKPISDYVDFPAQDNGATVRQVLRMRSGLPAPKEEGLRSLLLQDPDRHWEPTQTLADVPPQVGAPGPFVYSNTNYTLLGQLIEEVTATSYATALHTDLLDGHGLEGIAVQDVDRPRPPRVLPEPANSGSGQYVPNRSVASWFWASGGIAGDAASIARWGYLLYGGHVLPPDLVVSLNPVDDGTGYGFGTTYSESTLVPGLAFIGHDGDIGPYRSTLRVATDRPLSVAVLLLHDQQGSADPTTVAESIVAAL
jgi:D-alanyl-D-alanine carboxypeptidase